MRNSAEFRKIEFGWIENTGTAAFFKKILKTSSISALKTYLLERNEFFAIGTVFFSLRDCGLPEECIWVLNVRGSKKEKDRVLRQKILLQSMHMVSASR